MPSRPTPPFDDAVFRVAFERAAIGIAHVALDGRWVRPNRALCEMLGYSQRELQARTFSDVSHPDDREDGLTNARRLLAGEIDTYSTEKRYVRKHGSVVWIHLTASLVRDAEGNPAHFIAVIENIDDRKRLDDAAMRLGAIVESSDDAIVAKDLNGIVTAWNRGAQALFGYDAAEMIGRPISILIPPDRSEEESNILARISAGDKVEHFDTVRRRKDGQLVSVSVSISPIYNRDGRIVGASKIARDVTDRRKAEARLRDSEARLRFTLESAGLGDWELDVATGAWRGSLRCFQCFGYDEVVPNWNYRELLQHVHPADRAEVARSYRQALTSRTDWRFECRVIWPDGTVHWIAAHAGAGDDGDPPTRLLGVISDVTERKEIEAGLERRQARLDLAASAAGLGVFEWRLPDNHMTWENDRMYEIFGRIRSDGPLTLTQLAAQAVHPDDIHTFERDVAKGLAFQATFHSVCRVRRKSDGATRSVEFAGRTEHAIDGTPLRLLGVVSDVTERERAAREVRGADRRKDEFLATLSHELRNPLAPLRNAVQIMRLAPDPKQVADAGHVMERQLGHMVRLVDDLLDMSRITRGELTLRKAPVDFATVVRNAVETSRPLIDSKGHRLTVTLPAPGVVVDGDLTRLTQVLANLLNNAAKFSNRSGEITLSAERHANEVVVRVTDRGVGIPAEMLGSIFDMFMQVDQTLESSHGGLGIGLTLVRRLVELHGGTVEAHSAGRGAGSEFVVRLPITSAWAAVDTPMATPTVASPAAAVGRRILVVDDNEDSADSLAKLLELMGHAIATAHDGVEAVDAAESFRPEVILLDIGLPKLDGYGVARRIREQPWGKDMLLIAATGWGQQEDRRRSKEAGFDHHLVKPVDLAELVRLMGTKAVA